MLASGRAASWTWSSPMTLTVASIVVRCRRRIDSRSLVAACGSVRRAASWHRVGRAHLRVRPLSGVTPGTAGYVSQCIASPRVHPSEARPGTRDRSSRARDAACSSALVENVQPYLHFRPGVRTARTTIIARMYDAQQRAALANELAAAFLAAPWKVDAARRARRCVPGALAELDGRTGDARGCVHRTRPERRGELFGLIVTFLEEHIAPVPPPPPGERATSHRATARPAGQRRCVPTTRCGAPVPSRLGDHRDRLGPGACRAAGVEPGQLAWLADVRSLERTVHGSSCATTATARSTGREVCRG